MKYVTKFIIVLSACYASLTCADYREDSLRQAALHHSSYDPEILNKDYDDRKAKFGRSLFEDTRLAYGSNISCQTCHLDEFSSADGLPVAIGIDAEGTGLERVNGDGQVLTRNTLPLWGRAGNGFKAFFWDGRVEVSDASIVSPIGKIHDVDSALKIAIHLPFAEIDEMVTEDQHVGTFFKNESVNSAQALFDNIASKVKSNEEYVAIVSKVYGVEREQISFDIIADSIDHFIRQSFPIKNTKFYDFLSDNGSLSETEVSGGLLFYGKGKCASCHSGPYFSDFNYHVIPTLQVGYGKNGFGVDYGRFNVTHVYDDVYAFKTPPLYDVANTFPYMHSGSLYTLKEAIQVHFDPLFQLNTSKLDDMERVEFYRKVRAAGPDVMKIPFLSKVEIQQLVEFLETLSFERSR